MRPRRTKPGLFPVQVWPPFVDALTLVLCAFVLVVVAVAAVQSGLLRRLRANEGELERLRADKERVTRKLRALVATGPAASIEVDEGKVIVQGELLFDSGSDELSPSGRATLTKMAQALAALAAESPDQMVLIGGHTDDVPIANTRFPSNWELSAARATAVAHALVEGGMRADRLVAAGFGPYHPRASNGDATGRRQNRRIEVLLVPVHAVASR